MNKKLEEKKMFLEEQLEWYKKQDFILASVEEKLYEMRKLAEYAQSYELTPSEINHLTNQLDQLKGEVSSLELQLQSILYFKMKMTN